jgi:uncharacterized protein
MNAVRAVILALSLAWSFAASADVAVPPLNGPVVDETGTLSMGEFAKLSVKLKGLEKRKGSQIAVLIVPTTAPESIEQYSIRVAEAWKVGRKKIDDGALIVVAKDDHHLRIEVGYGLEGSLTDVTAHRIIDEVITPKFKAGDFAGGISDGIDRMIKIIDGEKLPAPGKPDWQKREVVITGNDLAKPFVLFCILMLGVFMRPPLGRLIAAIATGGVIAVVAWFIGGAIAGALLAGGVGFMFALFAAAIVPTGRGQGVQWNWGGSAGGWSGDRSSRDSGFSGGGSRDSDSDSGSSGGGSFGGGGASGSW